MSQPDEVSDDMLMALVDGEMNDTDAQRLRQRIGANPNLAARHADFVRTRALMQDAFPPEPVPDRLIAALLQGGDGSADAVPPRRRAAAAPGWGLALAASVLLAVGGFWAGRSTAPSLPGGGDIVQATVKLPTGGEARLPDGSTARVLASYPTEIGLCRMISQDGLRHVACRDTDTGGWTLAVTVDGGDAGGFRPAADVAVGLIDRFLDDVGAGPALSADEERRVLSQ